MILQFKGFNNNWTCREAENITWANVYVGKVTEAYRRGGDKYKNYQERLSKTIGFDKREEDLKYDREMHEAVDELICKEVGTKAGEIVYLIGNTPFDQLESVCVVIMNGKHSYITYVFTEGVYLKNNHGEPVQTLA